MGYIYKITCIPTQKIYIGLTGITPQQRWEKGHIYSAYLPSHSDYNFPFHRAIRKYGPESFKVETIEEVPNEQLKEREKYWIAYYDSYNKGYNATLGGDGQQKYDYEIIVNYFLQNNYSITKTCKAFQIYDQVVYSALQALDINYKNLQREFERTKHNKKIRLVEKNLTFNTMADIDNYFGKQVHPNIRRCLDGVTKKAYGYHWEEVNDE